MSHMRKRPFHRIALRAALAASLAALAAVPGGAGAAELHTSGAPLVRLLPSLTLEDGHRLKAGRTLQRQRVTLHLPSGLPEKLRPLLVELLSAPEAPVLWARQGASTWVLEESHARRLLAARMRAAEFEELLGRVQQEQARLPGLKRQMEETRDERKLLSLLGQYRKVVLLSLLSDDDLHSILGGQARSLRWEALPGEVQSNLTKYWRLAEENAPPAPGPRVPRIARDFTFSLAVGGAADDELNLWEVEADRDLGGAGAGPYFGSYLKGARTRLWMSKRVEFPPADQSLPGRRVDLRIEGDGEPKKEAIGLSLDRFLELLSMQNGLNIAADGYLRPAHLFATRPTLKDYPLTQVLQIVEELWGVTARWSTVIPEVLLVRAVDWAREDELDIDDATLAAYRAAATPGERPPLKELLRLAELSPRQLSRLASLNPDRAIVGLTRSGAARAPLEMLRFYSRLPAHLKEMALSPAGLSLGAAPGELVRETIGRFLRDGSGITQLPLDEMLFWLTPTEPGPPPDARFPAWTCRVQIKPGQLRPHHFYCPVPRPRIFTDPAGRAAAP